MLLAVDEAHGAHLTFYGGKLPHSAMAGADIWLHSAHKSLGALTPGAFLHLGDKKLAGRIRFWLQVMQTSSPSYPVMISLDLTRRQVAFSGTTLFSRSWRWARRFRHELREKGVIIFQPLEGKGFALDLCRTTLLCPQGEGRCLAKGWLISTVSRWSCITRGPCWPLWGLLSCPFLPLTSPVLLPRRGMRCACFTAGLPGQIIRGKHFRLLFLRVTVILQARGRENFFLHFL